MCTCVPVFSLLAYHDFLSARVHRLHRLHPTHSLVFFSYKELASQLCSAYCSGSVSTAEEEEVAEDALSSLSAAVALMEERMRVLVLETREGSLS